jgi:hypothetical protein
MPSPDTRAKHYVGRYEEGGGKRDEEQDHRLKAGTDESSPAPSLV